MMHGQKNIKLSYFSVQSHNVPYHTVWKIQEYGIPSKSLISYIALFNDKANEIKISTYIVKLWTAMLVFKFYHILRRTYYLNKKIKFWNKRHLCSMSLKCSKFLCYLNMENEFLGAVCLLAFTNATIQVNNKSSSRLMPIFY